MTSQPYLKPPSAKPTGALWLRLQAALSRWPQHSEQDGLHIELLRPEAWLAVLDALEKADMAAVQLDVRGTDIGLRVVDRGGSYADHARVWGVARRQPPPGWRQTMLRWRYPLGVSLALLGPDGTGKSTVATACGARLAHLFRDNHIQHLRPSLLPELRRLLDPRKWGTPPSTVVVTDPHSKPPASAASSLLRLLYYSGDYLLGYLPRVRAPAVRGELVMFDRYHADLLADPLRWRIGLPEAPRRLAAKRLPRPDLMVLLDAPAEVLVARKAELPSEEVARQLTVYRRLIAGMPGGHIVSVEQPPDAVAQQVCRLIIRHQQHAVRRRLQAILRQRP